MLSHPVVETPSIWPTRRDIGTSLPEVERADLASLGICRIYARNSEIYAQEDTAKSVYKVLSGAIRTTQLLMDGRRQIGGFYLPGEIFGLDARNCHRFAAEAVTEATLLVIRRDRLAIQAAQDAQFARQFWQVMASEIEHTQAHLMLLGRKTAVERLASFLLDIAARSDAGDEIQLPMGRQDIADFLGLTIETVSRTMTLFEHQKLIALPSSRRVILKNRRGLLELEG